MKLLAQLSCYAALDPLWTHVSRQAKKNVSLVKTKKIAIKYQNAPQRPENGYTEMKPTDLNLLITVPEIFEILESSFTNSSSKNPQPNLSSLEPRNNRSRIFRAISEIDLIRLLKSRKPTLGNLAKSGDLLNIFTLGFFIKNRVSIISSEIVTGERSSSFLPVISSLGVHCVGIIEERCSFYDPYEDNKCSASLGSKASIFCSKHIGEFDLALTVDDKNKKDLSSFTTMHKFYGDLKNLEEFSENALEEILIGFWSKFKKEHQTKAPSNIEIDDALRVLSIGSEDEFKKMNLVDLKKKYYGIAKNSHPDAGGSENKFVGLVESFEFLSNRKKTHDAKV
ncbi:hypothetical protein N9W79_01545 [bacterium]|nr:hypothetical protein [bacterium]